MDELELARKEINRIDKEMAALFEERMRNSRKVASYKAANGLAVKDEKREKELVERNKSYISDPEIAGYYVRFLKNTVELSCEYQTELMNGKRI